MQAVIDLVSGISNLPLEQLIGLIALAALAVAFFAIYVVFAIVTKRGSK